MKTKYKIGDWIKVEEDSGYKYYEIFNIHIDSDGTQYNFYGNLPYISKIREEDIKCRVEFKEI